jgi:peptidoglycan/xylan/chitin deacetylase (PgdA/CDA1 family)
MRTWWRGRGKTDPPVIVLLYHRIAEPDVDPLLLSVSPRRFADQLQVLRQRALPVRLRDLTNHVGKEGPAVVVTFDDGYADNLEAAEPLLRSGGVPVTVFVATGSLGAPTGFWWDELAAALLLPGDLPDRLVISVGGHALAVRLGRYSEENYRRLRKWSMTEDADPGPRQAAFRQLFRAIRPLREADRRAVLDQLREAGAPLPEPYAPILDAEGVARLAAGGLVEIGAHTVTHPVLATLTRAEQLEELTISKRELERLAGAAVLSFSYPFGGRDHYDRTTIATVRQAGFSRACVNEPGGIWPGSDPFRLPRVIVRDWEASEFERHLERWLHDPYDPAP